MYIFDPEFIKDEVHDLMEWHPDEKFYLLIKDATDKEIEDATYEVLHRDDRNMEMLDDLRDQVIQQMIYTKRLQEEDAKIIRKFNDNEEN